MTSFKNKHCSIYPRALSSHLVNKDQPFMSKWLTRLRKDLLRSGSLTELTLHLAKYSKPTASSEEWKAVIHSILDEEQKPDSDFVLAVDQWISQRNKPTKSSKGSEDQLDLL